MKRKQCLYVFIKIIFAVLCCVDNGFAQQKFGDNLGNHIAGSDLNMNSNSIRNIQLLSAGKAVIGTAAVLNNGSIALMVNGTSQAIVIPKVTDLLNVSAPSIPAANIVEGMIVYDLATHSFYVRDNTGWITYAKGVLPNGQVFVGDTGGNAQNITITGDVTINESGVTAIGSSKVLTAMLADQSVALSKIANGTAGQYLKTNAAGTAVQWTSVDPSKFVDLYNRQGNIKGFKTFISDSGFVATGTFGSGGTPVTTPGARMIWHPKRAALKVGNLASGGLDDANTGNYSAAFGSSTASGEGSFAAGLSKAIGNYGVAFGESQAADFAIAGGNSIASGPYAVAFGLSTASGTNSVAMGLATSSGNSAIAMGNSAVASGANSVAIGYKSNTNNYSGSFAFADGIGEPVTTSAINQFTSRFTGGYIFYTNLAGTVGVTLAPGANSWSTISDKRKKENFEPVDPELFLHKIDTLSISSWNYKGQDPKTSRHYGPMAQDFYGAFGKDKYGKIGNDTTIASADIDGVNMIAVQGLIKRSNELTRQLENAEKLSNNLLKNINDEQIDFESALKKISSEAEGEQLKILAVIAEVEGQKAKVKQRLEQITASKSEQKKDVKGVNDSWYEAVAELIRKTVINANKR
jgi:hypothetical protein